MPFNLKETALICPSVALVRILKRSAGKAAILPSVSSIYTIQPSAHALIAADSPMTFLLFSISLFFPSGNFDFQKSVFQFF
jgi:hypothetical protein